MSPQQRAGLNKAIRLAGVNVPTPTVGVEEASRTEAALAVLAYNLETSIMGACANFAREAMLIGRPDHAVPAMAQAIAIAESMTDSGRDDLTGAMMIVGELLERDGIREEVFASAAKLREAS